MPARLWAFPKRGMTMGNTIKLLCILGPLVLAADLIAGLVQGKGTLAQRWGALWSGEHWLVCDALSGVRQALSTPLFCVLIVLWWGWGVVEQVCELFCPPHLLTVLTVARSLLIAGVVLAKILGCTRYAYRDLLPAAVIFAYFVKLYSVCQYPPVIRAVFLFLAAKDTKLVQDLWAMLASALLAYGTTVGLALAGFLDKMATAENGRVRYALGYGSYNSLGIATAELVILWLCLRYRKLRWWDLLIAAAGMAFIQIVPNSRGALMICAIVLVILLLGRLAPRLTQKRWMPWAAGAVALAPALFTFGAVWMYDRWQDKGWMQMLDRLFSGRVGFAWVQQYGFRPAFFGEKFGPLGESLLYRVDNAYVYYRFLCGPLMLLLFLAGSAWLCWRLARRGGTDWALLAVSIGYLGYAVMERMFYPNVFILLLCNVAYGRSQSLSLEKSPAQQPGPKE